jgi:aspartate oxidase
VDKMLGPYLTADLAAGRITLDEARDLLAHFWIKGCEWITADGRGSGDAQFYQNVVLAGGGPGQIYQVTVYPRGQVGVHGLAYRAGLVGNNLTELVPLPGGTGRFQLPV